MNVSSQAIYYTRFCMCVPVFLLCCFFYFSLFFFIAPVGDVDVVVMSVCSFAAHIHSFSSTFVYINKWRCSFGYLFSVSDLFGSVSYVSTYARRSHIVARQFRLARGCASFGLALYLIESWMSMFNFCWTSMTVNVLQRKNQKKNAQTQIVDCFL